jgi:hypothetical protein
MKELHRASSLGKAARQIVNAVHVDRSRALIGPDAKAIDRMSRLPAVLPQSVLTEGATQLQR